MSITVVDEVNKTVTIPVDEYDEMLERLAKLDALEGAGVDNWEGYDWAMESLQDPGD